MILGFEPSDEENFVEAPILPEYNTHRNRLASLLEKVFLIQFEEIEPDISLQKAEDEAASNRDVRMCQVAFLGYYFMQIWITLEATASREVFRIIGVDQARG